MTDFDTSGFLASFFDEARERLASVNRRLVLLESGNLEDEGLSLLNRDLHTIKGAAQMLGVQDVGAIAHLLEDVLVFTSEVEGPGAQPAVQFLFDLHDHLADRLRYEDSEVRIQIEQLSTQFQTIKAEYVQGRAKLTTEASRPVSPKRQRKKRAGINKNLIAAVMGTIENSIQADRSAIVETENAQTAKESDKQQQPDITTVEIDYRPVLSQIEAINSAQDDGSGNFFRVDRSKLNRLSNQIIELSSDRYRGDAMEAQLEKLHTDLKLLKNSIFSPQDQQQTVQSLKMQAELEQSLTNVQKTRESFRLHQKRSSVMLGSLRGQVFGLMLRSLDSVFSLFPRAVRDISKQSNKKVQLLVAGESVEMDQVAAEALSEPLIHLINNAIAHGIESPTERLQSGKPEEGQITIYAHKSGAGICIEVLDDGKGIDIEQVRRKAVEVGIVTQSEADDMDAAEALELIFHAGFSTRPMADQVAGRGIGLNVVSNVLRELTGTIHIQTEQGKGTKFTLTVPVSLTLQKAIEFMVDEKRFGILSNLVSSTLPLAGQEIKTGKGAFSQGYIDYAGHRVPVVDLHQILAGKQGHQTRTSATNSVIMIEHLESFLAVIVDKLFDEKEIIVREIDPYLKHYHPLGLMGNAIADDGSVLLLIEPNGLKEMWRTAPAADINHELLHQATFDHRMLLVDDSPIALDIERQIFESMGFKVDVAMGSADALEKLLPGKYELLVTDLNMPDMNGIRLVKQIKDLQSDLPVLMLATRCNEDEQERAIRAGVGCYLTKRDLKDRENELIEALDHLLGMKKQ